MRHRVVLWSLLVGLLVAVQAWRLYQPECRGDFRAFYASSLALQAGADPYAPVSGLDAPANANPPLFLLLCQPLGYVPCATAFTGVAALSTIGFVASAALFVRKAAPRTDFRTLVWLCAATPFWYTIHMGQAYVLAFVLLVFGWLALSRNRLVLAGIPIGVLVALKPNLALWPLALLLTPQRRASLSALVVASILTAASIRIFGSESFSAWLRLGSSSVGAPLVFPVDMSLFAVVSRLRISVAYAPLGVGLLLACGWWCWRQRPSWHDCTTMGISLSLLLAPHAWVGYGLLLYPSYLTNLNARAIRTAMKILLYVPAPLMWVLAEHAQQQGHGWPDAVLHLLFALPLPLTLASVLTRRSPDGAALRQQS